MAPILIPVREAQHGEWLQILKQVDHHLPGRIDRSISSHDPKQHWFIHLNKKIQGAVFIDPAYEGLEDIGCYLQLPTPQIPRPLLQQLIDALTAIITEQWPDRSFFLQTKSVPDLAAQLKISGFEPGFGFHQLEKLPVSLSNPPSSLMAHPFEEQHLGKYLKCWAKGFECLRRAIDLKPFLWALEHPEAAHAEMQPFIETGQFHAYWKDDDLMALAWHKGNFIENLVVDPNHQYEGIGTLALQDLQKRIFPKNIYLDVVLENSGALRFYQKNGFRIVGSSILYWKQTC